MPRQNRVTPLSELVADPGRGLVYGNRGCLHDERGRIRRLQGTRRWIACRLEFKGWHRSPLMQRGRFTELFFLDEATAFAAGHRPCALCRREDYRRFLDSAGAADADAIDDRLDGERLDGARRRLHDIAVEDLPDGAFVLHQGLPRLVLGPLLLRWTPAGYLDPVARRRGSSATITPPTFLDVLRQGWTSDVPLFHPTVAAATISPR